MRVGIHGAYSLISHDLQLNWTLKESIIQDVWMHNILTTIL
jgi:hypothetical protein